MPKWKDEIKLSDKIFNNFKNIMLTMLESKFLLIIKLIF